MYESNIGQTFRLIDSKPTIMLRLLNDKFRFARRQHQITKSDKISVLNETVVLSLKILN